MNRSEEDYVKAVYEFTRRTDRDVIRTNMLADHFGYTDQSVNEMVNRLAKKGLLVFYPYKGVALTEEGRKEAIRMIRSHRIWEVFLAGTLKMPVIRVHEEAEQLEHATSEDVVNALYEFLGRPERCQYGNPIPDASGNVTIPDDIPLSECHEGDVFVLERISDSRELIGFLTEKSIRLGDRFTVTSTDPFNNLMELRRNAERLVVAMKTARLLYGTIHD